MEKDLARKVAEKVGLLGRRIKDNGTEWELVGIEDGIPYFSKTGEEVARKEPCLVRGYGPTWLKREPTLGQVRTGEIYTNEGIFMITSIVTKIDSSGSTTEHRNVHQTNETARLILSTKGGEHLIVNAIDKKTGKALLDTISIPRQVVLRLLGVKEDWDY